MGTFRVVGLEVSIKVYLHLLHGFVPLLAALEAEMFIEQGAVQPLDKSVALRPTDPGGAVFDPLTLQEQLVRMTVRAAAKLPAVVGENGGNPGLVLLEKRQHVFVEHMHGRHRQLGGIETTPGIPGMAIDDRLEIYSANPLEDADEKGVHRHEIAGVPGFDVPLSKLRAEPFQQANLSVAEVQLLLTDCFFEA